MKIRKKPKSEKVKTKELTFRILFAGILLTIVFGFANVYLGLKAGITIAATYPAAVLGMELIRHFKKSNILEENMLRTIGSIGESVAGGAIFTIPAFIITDAWDPNFFSSYQGYLQISIILLIGGVSGILFASLLRKILIDDPKLPFPESIAASEIHKSGRSGKTGAKYLFFTMGVGGLIEFLKNFNLLPAKWESFFRFSKKTIPGTEFEQFKGIETGGGILLKSPALSPAFIGIGYIIGPRLAALNFAGGILAWGLFVPLFVLILAPQYSPLVSDGVMTWAEVSKSVFSNIVKPIAIGGMLSSAAYTLWGMRGSILKGLIKSGNDVTKRSKNGEVKNKDKDVSPLAVFAAIFILSGFVMIFFWWLFGFSDEGLVPSVFSALVVIIGGYIFAAVSGYQVGMIGSSNNPVSGITIFIILITAVFLTAIGFTGSNGMILVLSVAGVICVSAAVAGEMFQDLKIGYLLGGTPWKMQAGDFIGVVIASFVMWIPMFILNAGDLKMAELNGYRGGFGGDVLAAPQAGVMAQLTKGIVGGELVWPLITVGIIMGMGFVLVKVKSPMLVCVGMYLSFEVVAAIFAGGIIKWIVDMIIKNKDYSKKEISGIVNRGVLLASGLIAGEAMMGIMFAALAFFDVGVPNLWKGSPFILSTAVIIALGFILVRFPLDTIKNGDRELF